MGGNGGRGGSLRREGALTRREREILELLAQGLSGAEIAARLVLSPETVRTHIRNAMSKLGARTRSHAVFLALVRHEIGTGRAQAPSAGEEGREPGGDRQQTPGRRARATVRARTLEPALRALLGGIVSLYEVVGGALFLTDEEGTRLRCVAHFEVNDQELLAHLDEIAVGEGPIGQVALERWPQIVRGASLGVRGEERPRTLIVAPMLLGGDQLAGVLCLTGPADKEIADYEALLLQPVADQIAEALAAGDTAETMSRFRHAVEWFKASLAVTVATELAGPRRTAASHDGLTGLPGRDDLREWVEALIAAHRRSGEPFAVVWIGVDGLSRIDEVYGREAGDRMAAATAALIEGQVRAADRAFKVAADEFTVVAPYQRADQARPVAERLRALIPSSRPEESRLIGICIGLASCPAHGTAAEELLAAANQAARAAREQGTGIAIAHSGNGGARSASPRWE